MGKVYPRTNHNPPYLEIITKDSYFAVIVAATQVWI